jgi:hypothetical protein
MKVEKAPIEQVLDLTKETQFAPTAIHLHSRKDCTVVVMHLWKYAMMEMSINEVFHLVDEWAQRQPEREECMRVIMTTLIGQYCPHYTFTCVENDTEYQKHLKEHREMYQLSEMIASEINGTDDRENVFGDRPRLRR